MRSAVFSISASALPALLPLLAHPFGSQGYGLLLGFFGVGALAGATVMPLLRRECRPTRWCQSLPPSSPSPPLLRRTWRPSRCLRSPCLIAGIAWIQILASLNVSAQTMCPSHMRARAISMYLLVLQGGLAGGAALWGEVAEQRRHGARRCRYAAIGLLARNARRRLVPASSRPTFKPNTAGMD